MSIEDQNVKQNIIEIVKYTYILFYVSFYCISCVAQTSGQIYSQAYDLNFTMKGDSSIRYPWIENAAYANYTIPVFKGDSDHTLFTKVYLKGFPYYDKLKTEYIQRILLPFHKEKEGCIEFEYKGSNLSSVSIILDGISDEEKTVYSDTLKLTPDNNVLATASKKIALTDIDLLNIRINAEGESNKSADFTFSTLNLLIGEKAIDEFPIRELPAVAIKKKITYTPIDLDTGKGIEEITDINNKEIIGIGESIHGNNSIRKLVNQIIFQAVEKQNCRLILMEMPLEKTLSLNRFIQSSGYTVDSLETLKPEIRTLLDTLRIYNSDKKNEDKVKLFGMDYNTSYSVAQRSAIDIFDFVAPLNQQLKNPEVDEFTVLLMEEDWGQAINFLETHRANIQKVLTIDEIDCILHILTLSRNMGKDGIKRFIDRDSVMFLNTKFLIDTVSSSQNLKTIVYGHAVHINPVSTFPAVPTVPFGRYMKRTYKEKYSLFFILIGEGSTSALDAENNRINNSLALPPRTSMEFLLDSFNEEALYLPVDIDFNRLILSRFKGSHHIVQEFYPFNLYRRCHGIFFIRKGYHEQDEKNESLFEEFSKRHILKNKYRKNILEEIKKRIHKEL